MRVRGKTLHILALSGILLTLFAAPSQADSMPPTGCNFIIGTPRRTPGVAGTVRSTIDWACIDVTDGQLIADLWLCHTRPVRRPAGIWYCRIAQRKDDMRPRVGGSGSGQADLFARTGRGFWCVNASWWYKRGTRITWGTKRSRSCPFLSTRG